ncbi:MAG: ABC transporter ATP-binding protein [Acidimicrobiia bacterium]|nr:ABC transporter ATP-binding protein/permease [Acidimicrobiia bacterium]NNF10864.1 ABC transporter ATP-binding protein [Acidimicrobiia bacterium]NNL71236.1 ABC transporter ATP-binding protein [Acidimicrobiia bacterium]
MDSETRSAVRRLLWYASGYRGRIYAAVSFSVLNKVFDILPPLLIGLSVDVVVEREGSFIARFGPDSIMGQLWYLAAITAVVWVLESVFEYLLKVYWRNLAQDIQHEIRLDAYRHVQELELAYFEDRSTGGLMAILNDDVNQLERFLNDGANEVVQVVTTVVSIGLAFFIIEWRVAWIAFLPMPIILWGSFKFQQWIAPRYADVREKVGLLNASLSNNLSGIATIKSFTAEDHEKVRIGSASRAYVESNRRAIRISSTFVPLIRMAILSGFIATLVLGGYYVSEQSLAVGGYTVLVFLTQRLLWPLTRLGETFDQYQRAMASTDRILNLLDTPVQVVGGQTELNSPVKAGRVDFEDVSFAYGNDVPVLRNLSFTAPAGDTIAIVGPTGAGKSTIIKLLLRFYEVTGGRITVDDHDISDLRFSDLRRAIGLVSQDVFLFHGTVRENIAYGRPDATHEEVVEAATIAEAHEFISGFPDGYDTIVGERGQKLSGGQRQRVSIARAVLKDPPILVLDEATSSVDNETEAAIQRSLEKISIDRTTIVIAHRLSTVRHADHIYVVESGIVVEDGHHDDLLERDGLYAALWKVQTGTALQ